MKRLVLLLLFAVVLALGCGRTGPNGDAVDDVLLAYLSTARVLHREADIAEDSKRLEDASAALERLLAIREPRSAPEIDEVIADTHARLADLLSQRGDHALAMKHVEQGLARAPNTSYFRGHLFEVRGLVEQRHAKDLEAKGDLTGAAEAKDRAMKAYEEAITIQGEVIKRGTADAGAP